MRLCITSLIIFCSVISFARTNKIVVGAATDSTIKILVLPPYDRIANAGVSPDTQSILETNLSKVKRFTIIPFPFKALMGVPYQMVFDKKYCKPIVQKVDCDIIIMTQLITDNEMKPGIWPWAYKVRIYNVKKDIQVASISGDNLDAEDIEQNIVRKLDKLVKDIEATFSK